MEDSGNALSRLVWVLEAWCTSLGLATQAYKLRGATEGPLRKSSHELLLLVNASKVHFGFQDNGKYFFQNLKFL